MSSSSRGFLPAARAVLSALALLALPAAECAAQDAQPDCPQIGLPNLDDPTLTREEKIELLDEALLDALNQTDPCQLPGGGASGGGGGDGGGGSGANSGGGSAVESQAAGDVQGDLAEDADPQKDSDAAKTAGKRASGKSRAGGRSGGRRDGALPPDIPASTAANDDIIAKQFRRAAEEETDPKVRAQLWNDYRRYKGLPERPVPDSET